MKLILIFLFFGLTTVCLAENTSWQPWQWPSRNCARMGGCQLWLDTQNHPLMQNRETQRFVAKIQSAKEELQQLYPGWVSDDEYIFLAHMATGILGRESKFFQSPRYRVRELLPGLVTLVKIAISHWHGDGGNVDLNSRGPTQIKVIPRRIAETYKITPDDLAQPEYAALATMGYLIESLPEFKQLIKNRKWRHINPSNYVDYLPYLYFGARRRLFRKEATPETNIYVQEMKRHMALVQVFIAPNKRQIP